MHNIKKATCNVVILAVGFGTLLFSRYPDLPKPMVPVNGKPLLQHQIELCADQGFTDILLLLHHKHEAITQFLSDSYDFNLNIRYCIEDYPMGTAGALFDASEYLAPDFLVLYGDTYLDVDLDRFFNFHKQEAADATLFLHPNDHPSDSDLIQINKDSFVDAVHPYPHSDSVIVRNLVNAALYALKKDSFISIDSDHKKPDIAKHIFPKMISMGMKLKGYLSPEYIKDMGTPDRLDKVERDIVAGLPEKLSGRQLRKAVFIDRDGTINHEVNHLKSPEQLELLPGTPGAIRRLNRSGRLAVVITNQPVIARGDVNLEELNCIHARLEHQLGISGAYLDRLYFCPHHPDKGFSGEIPELKVLCNCRKPEPGLIEQACHDLAIGRQDSWIVGDSTSDVEAGRRAGLRTVLVRTGHAGADAKYVVRPDYTAPDLADAVDWILEGHVDLTRRIAPIAVQACRGTRLVLIGGLARAGKSYAAQVLKELLHALGRQAHTISLDGWLKPKTIRTEGCGVCERFDLAAASASILSATCSNSRFELAEPLYDRFARSAGAQHVEHSVGPEDVLIVEGVPALLMEDLLRLPGVIKIYVDAMPEDRQERLKRDYAWRGTPNDELLATLTARDLDETPIVERSRNLADFVVEQVFQDGKKE